MFSFRKPVHSASFFSHCLCMLLFIVATLFIAAVRVLSDSYLFRDVSACHAWPNSNGVSFFFSIPCNPCGTTVRRAHTALNHLLLTPTAFRSVFARVTAHIVCRSSRRCQLNCGIKVNLRTRNRGIFQHRCAVCHCLG